MAHLDGATASNPGSLPAGVRMDRCIDATIGVKVLSYDLLEEEEKVELDAHLEKCAACRDLRQQTFGKEGALDELAARVYRLRQRRPVEGHIWIAERLRDLWLPFMILAFVVAAVGFFLA